MGPWMDGVKLNIYEVSGKKYGTFETKNVFWWEKHSFEKDMLVKSGESSIYPKDSGEKKSNRHICKWKAHLYRL